MAIKGCLIKNFIQDGRTFFNVKKTVFEKKENAELYAYYLRAVLLNGGMVVYVKDFNDFWELFREMEPQKNLPIWKQWFQTGWNKNEGKYIHVNAGMFAVDNIGNFAA